MPGKSRRTAKQADAPAGPATRGDCGSAPEPTKRVTPRRNGQTVRTIPANNRTSPVQNTPVAGWEGPRARITLKPPAGAYGYAVAVALAACDVCKVVSAGKTWGETAGAEIALRSRPHRQQYREAPRTSAPHRGHSATIWPCIRPPFAASLCRLYQ